MRERERESNNTTTLIETQHTRALLPPFSPSPPTFVENEIDGRRRTSCVTARIRTTRGGHSAEGGWESGALGRPEQRKTATRSEWESGRERDREGRDEEEDPIRISIYSRKGSVKRRERAEGGRGKECARGKGNLLFLSRSFETHIHTAERETHHTEEMKYGAVWRRESE